jgi:hypothetical protein
MSAQEEQYPYYWTREDIRTLHALMDSEHLNSREPVSALSIVNAARAFERTRIIDLLLEQDKHLLECLTPVLVWLHHGAKPVDITTEYGRS